MGINTATKRFQENLIQLINGSNLPPINILFVMENVRILVTEIYEKALEEEKGENKDGNKNNICNNASQTGTGRES